MSASATQLGELTDAGLRTLDVFGDASGIVMLGASGCPRGGMPHITIGTDSVESLARLVSELSEVTRVAQVHDAPMPAWAGDVEGLRLFLYVFGALEEF